MQTPLTGARLRNHFVYNGWKYILLIVLALFFWDMVYQVTAYEPPPDRKLDIYLVSSMGDAQRLEEDLTPRLAEALPDQEEIHFYHIALGGEADYTASMQLTTYLGAGQGDLYLLPRDRFLLFAREQAAGEAGALRPLTEDIESGLLDLRGIDPAQATFDGQVLGVPAQDLYGLLEYGIVPQSLYFMIPSFGENQENAVRLLDVLIETMRQEKPEGYDEYLRQLQRNLLPERAIP